MPGYFRYKNIPFYLSNHGYGLLINHPGQVEFEIGTARVSQLQFSVPGEEQDYYVFLGEPKKRSRNILASAVGNSANVRLVLRNVAAVDKMTNGKAWSRWRGRRMD